jgi:hypothetical protein
LLAAVVLASAAGAAGAGAAAPPAWKTVTSERHAGAVSATLSIQRRASKYGFFTYRKLELVVKDAGKTVFSRPLCTSERCSPGSKQTLELKDVWDGSADEALVSIYTGGAHCCFQSLVVLVDGAHPGRLLAHDWGDPGYRGQRRNGTFYFISADDRFAYAFTSFAGSGLPVQVWSIDAGGRFVDVTASRLDLVRSDAAVWWKAYISGRGAPDGDIRGVLAAWCADEYRLGDPAACDTELASALRAGYLNGPSGWPRNQKYIATLKKSLAGWGY